MKRLLQQINKLLFLLEKELRTNRNYRFTRLEGGLITSSVGLVSSIRCEKCKNYTPLEPEKEISGYLI